MITEVKHYIEEHYANPDLSLNHLSERFQISAKYASYLFKEEFNMKFVDFLAELRLMKAKELLETTSESIQDIALQIGYANSITFGRVFKRITGMTPGITANRSSIKMNKHCVNPASADSGFALFLIIGETGFNDSTNT